MIVHCAAWVLPIAAPPIRDGWVAVDRGSIVAVGGPDSSTAAGVTEAFRPASPFVSSAILPGLVNAHTHLELSWLRGQVPPADSMPAWASQLISARQAAGADPVEPIADAIREARAAGTSLVGDVTNTLASYEPLADSDLSACVFRELLGFHPDRAAPALAEARAQFAALTPIGWLRPSLVPHAPYSVSPALLRALAADGAGRVVTIHLGESREEIEFLRDGTGPWRQLLQRLQVWDPAWTPPACGPVEYIDRCGLLRENLIAVHGVQLTDDELAKLARAGATLVTCLRSNVWTGAGAPPVARFYASGVRVAVGTDSLSSVDDLNLFAELAAIRAAAPGVPAASLLSSATRDGAAALGFGQELGTIEAGKRAELIAIRVPEGIEDVEEYLVGGVEPVDIRWLNAG